MGHFLRYASTCVAMLDYMLVTYVQRVQANFTSTLLCNALDMKSSAVTQVRPE
jgi:hypothetical protein